MQGTQVDLGPGMVRNKPYKGRKTASKRSNSKPKSDGNPLDVYEAEEQEPEEHRKAGQRYDVRLLAAIWQFEHSFNKQAANIHGIARLPPDF